MSEPNDLAVLQDMLALVGVRVTMRELEHRTAKERLAAERWSRREIEVRGTRMVSCGCKPPRRLPRPAWLRRAS